MQIWAVTTGEAGMRSQAMGLAEAVGGEIVEKIVLPKKPWQWLPGHLSPRSIGSVVHNPHDFGPPLPDLAIVCGRRSIPAALALRASGVVAIYVQHPRIPPRYFDLVVSPSHDGLAGPNVEQTSVAIHRVTPAKLAIAAAEWRPRLEGTHRPLTAVLIGGKSRAYQFGRQDADAMAANLLALQDSGHKLWITTSRRTGKENTNLLRQALPKASFWSSEADGPNPLMGMLALADHIVVTGDSVSMISEAVSTGTPVHIAELPGGTKRFRRFLDGVYECGYARPFTGPPLPEWTYSPPRDTARIAAIVQEMVQTKSSKKPR